MIILFTTLGKSPNGIIPFNIVSFSIISKLEVINTHGKSISRLSGDSHFFRKKALSLSFRTFPKSFEGKDIPALVCRNLQQFEQQHLRALPRLRPPRLHHWSHSFLQELPRFKPEGAWGAGHGRPHGPRRRQLRVSKPCPAQNDAFRSVHRKQALLDVLLQAVQVFKITHSKPPSVLSGFTSRPAVQTLCFHSWSSTSVWRNLGYPVLTRSSLSSPMVSRWRRRKIDDYSYN